MSWIGTGCGGQGVAGCGGMSWNLSLESFRLDLSTWELSLRIVRAEVRAWHPWLGIFCLGSWPRALDASQGQLLGMTRLDFVAWHLSHGVVRFGTCACNVLLGIFRL